MNFKKLGCCVLVLALLFSQSIVGFGATKIGTPALKNLIAVSDETVKVIWSKLSNVDGYQVFRSQSKSGSSKLVGTVYDPSVVTYVDKTVKNGETYYYHVRGFQKLTKGRRFGSISKTRSVTVKYTPLESIDFSKLLKDVSNIRREKINETTTFNGFEAYIIDDDSDYSLLTDEEIALIMKQHKWKKSVSYKKAVSDIDLLFRAFRESYACYYYFGQEKFDQAEATVMKWLKGRKTVSVNSLQKKLAASLKFIDDCHFDVSGRTSKDRANMQYQYFYCEDGNLSKDNHGYYKYFEEEKYYVMSINNKNVSIEPSLMSNGDVLFSTVLLCEKSQMKNSVMTLRSADGKIKELTLIWTAGKAYSKQFSGADFECDLDGGIAYISVRSMKNQYEGQLSDFVDSGNIAKKARAVIFDLRGNLGGSDRWGAGWFEAFTGKSPKIKLLTCRRTSRLSIAKGYGQQTDEYGFGTPYYEKGTFVENNIPIIVLVDAQVASSGESMLSFLKTLNNVIVVGSNTMGCQLCGNNGVIYLPNTGMYAYFGIDINYINSMENVEFKGYKPDIWCSPDSALRAVEALVQKSFK